MSRTFTFQNGYKVSCDTAQEAYDEGLRTGTTGVADYCPGGPWVPRTEMGNRVVRPRPKIATSGSKALTTADWQNSLNVGVYSLPT